MSLFRFCATSLSAVALAGLAAPASAHPGHPLEGSAMELLGVHIYDALFGAAPATLAGLALMVAIGLAFAVRRRGVQQIDSAS